MEVLNHLRSSFRSSPASAVSNSSIRDTDRSPRDSDTVQKKRARNVCDLCGKRLLKLAGWRNYFTLPCKCHHVFCKRCITGRLQCRQKVLRSVSFDLMWTFPCPSSSQCGQELTVDFSRGHSYSKNLVARELGSGDNSWEQEEEEDMDSESACSDSVKDESDIVCRDDESRLREIG